MPKITFTIGHTGSVKIDASGFKGKACQDATRPFEDALGGTQEANKKRRPKPEMNQQNRDQQR